MSASVIPLSLASRKAPFAQICHDASYRTRFVRAKTLHVFLFDAEDRLLSLWRDGSYDFLHGRQEWDDDDPAAAARREVSEQTHLTMGIATRAGVIEIGPSALGPARFELVMTGFVQEAARCAFIEDTPYTFLSVDAFVAQYRLGNSLFLCQLIDQAKRHRKARRYTARRRQIKAYE